MERMRKTGRGIEGGQQKRKTESQQKVKMMEGEKE